MGFWKKVDDYLQYKGISRKELALGIGMKVQTLDRDIQRDSEPKLVNGIQVCKFLDVPLDEFLDEPITLPNELKNEAQIELKHQINLYRKYHDLIHNCEILPENEKLSVHQLAQTLAESAPAYAGNKK